MYFLLIKPSVEVDESTPVEHSKNQFKMNIHFEHSNNGENPQSPVLYNLPVLKLWCLIHGGFIRKLMI
jgi:hypothetical protein